jgi:hypothetical protein
MRIQRLLIVIALVLGMAGCKARALHYDPVIPAEGVATQITLEIYGDGDGVLRETRTLDTEGPVVVEIDADQPFTEAPSYYIYARAQGYYSELYYVAWGDTIDVDLDAVPELDDTLAGVVFEGDDFAAHQYYANQPVQVRGPGGEEVTVNTDDQGRFGLASVEPGTYRLQVTCDGEVFDFEMENGESTDYSDLLFYPFEYARAPNLYLYPETTTDVSVKLGFPQGGQVWVSDPPYGDGWQVTVDPDGIIDDAWGYLFYEARLPRRIQTSRGWVLGGEALGSQLRGLLTRLGFRGREIDDFVEYWVPELAGTEWWAAYPMEPEALVTLRIDPAPRRLHRVWLYLDPLAGPMSLPEPALPGPVDREGFFAAEWGIVLGR